MPMDLLRNLNKIMLISNQQHSRLIKKELGILEVLIFILDFLRIRKICRKLRHNMMRNHWIIREYKEIKLVIWISMLMAKTIMIALTAINLRVLFW
mgnify:CR=1 FL=1